ncbi:MAG: polysaccharide pyruvyl transferase family protein [Bacteroidaceae bacterium]|nr:polysaccharide pyruvyl transferase family protein [Bacteroidaceae bacterium]
MKIGIITQPLHCNYGGLLQNYALQQVLGAMGHSAVTIDEGVKPDSFVWHCMSAAKTLLLKMAGKGAGRVLPHWLTRKERECINRNVDYFTRKYIKSSGKLPSLDDVRGYVETGNFDAFVAGSDQVWRPCYNSSIERPFLAFAQGLPVKRISYAASFGVDFWEYTPEQTAVAVELIKSFDAVSVREESAIALCREHLQCNARLALDPTMLLDKEKYEALVIAEGEPRSAGNLFTYILDNDADKQTIIEAVAKQRNLQPFAIMPQRVDAQSIRNIGNCVYPTVTAWLRAFMDAEFVVCDSFHGAVFSIIFNKPFIVLANSARGNARFTSLLALFGLGERMTDSSRYKEIIHKEIDWQAVNKRKEALRAESLMFLQNCLQ